VDERVVDELFPHEPGRAVLRAVADAVGAIGEHEVRVSRSQVAFRRRRGFAYVWRPGRYVHSDVPAVLSLALPVELHDERFKQVAHPSASVWMHHLELASAADVDDQVRSWLRQAFDAAG
jgi:Domain of unknown function (DUF5655)